VDALMQTKAPNTLSALPRVDLVTLLGLGMPLADLAISSSITPMMPAGQPSSTRRVGAIFALFLFGIVAGTAAWWFRSELKGTVMTWRAKTLVKEARELGAAGDWKTAEFRALAAHQMAPDLLEARELFFEAALEGNSRYLLPAAYAAFSHPGATPETQIKILESMLRSGQAAAFVFLHQKLDHATRARDEAVLLLVDFLILSNHLEQARGVLEARLQQGPDQHFTVKLIHVLLSPGWTDLDRTRAHKLLAGLGAARGEEPVLP